MRRCVVALAALVLVSGFAGCGRLLGQRYDNFTAYYNTFYNAKREFEREERELLDAERPVEQDRYLTLFVEPVAGQQAAEGGFAKAIEKGADLLREHPESKWVDDALLLIGKAYFYQGNVAGAEQKFREMIALDENRLEDEAWLWLGRTLTAAERYDDAALALREGLDRPGVRERWADLMRLALAEVDVREGEWDEAETALIAGLDGLRDDALAARAEFLLGQVYETLDRPTEAAQAYRRVLGYGPRYEMAYAARISHALTLGLSGETERSLDELGRMRRDDKNLDNLAEIELTRARVLAAAGRPDEARALLRSLLYDPDPALRIGDVRGRIHYVLADVYRERLRDYVRAAAHYDTAATAIRTSFLPDEQTTPRAIIDSEVRSSAFGSFARVSREVADMDSLLYLGGLDDEAFAGAIEQIRAQRERESQDEARDLARRRSEQAFRGGGGVDFGDDRQAGAGGPAAGDGGFLNYRNPAQLQEELVAFQARWGDRPLRPNWRRAAAIGGGVAVQEGVADTFADIPSITTTDFSRDEFVDTSPIPRDPFTQERMRASRAAARYELGNVLFLSLAEPDSAAALYRLVVEESTESPVTQRAYFALAETQRALGNETEAERLYREVIGRYPDSPFAGQARTQLGLAPVEVAPTADSLGMARAGYESAYAEWKEGRYADALRSMLALSERFPTTPTAARARLAAGAIYTEWAAGDEEALLAAEPFGIITEAPDGAMPVAPPSTTPAGADSVSIQPSSAPAASTGRVYTWVVASNPTAETSEQAAAAYREQGYDASVVPGAVQGRESFRVTIGRFGSRAEAEAVRSVLPPDAPSETWLLALPRGTPVPDTLPLRPPTPEADSTAADSTAIAAVAPVEPPIEPDSAGDVAGDESQEAVPDSTEADPLVGAEETETPWLEDLYASIETDFPGTPYAERARLLRDALSDVFSGEPLTAISAIDPVRGELPLEMRENAFSWSVFSSDRRSAVEDMVFELVGEGFRAALLAHADGETYEVLVGQFEGRAAAEASRASLPEVADSEAYRIVSLDPSLGELTQ